MQWPPTSPESLEPVSEQDGGTPAVEAAPTVDAPPIPQHSVRTKNPRLREKLSAAGAAILAFLAKFKAIFLVLGKIKLLSLFGTMFVSIAAYALLFGWQFGVGLVLLFFVHELGHVLELRRQGIKATGLMFIPLLGAVTTWRQSASEDASTQARVALAGPVLGAVGALVCEALWHSTGNDLFRVLAFVGFFLNLFNLLPLIPFDGARALAATAPWMRIVGLVVLLPLVLVFNNAMLLILVIVAAAITISRHRSGDPELQAYRTVKPVDRVLVGAVYLALIALLVTGMHATYLPRSIS